MKEEIIDKRLRNIRPLIEIRNLGEYDIEVTGLKAELQAQKEAILKGYNRHCEEIKDYINQLL